MAVPNTTDGKVSAAIRVGVIAAIVFSAGLLAGILLSGRTAGEKQVTGAAPSVNTGSPAAAGGTSGDVTGSEESRRGPAPASYPGTVKKVLKDGLVIEAPKQKAVEAPLTVTVRVTSTTVFWANVPKTSKELSAGGSMELPPGSVPQGAQAVPPPASAEALKQPYKKVAIKLSDFKENDVVTFVTTGNPASMREVTATEIGWIATLLKQAADGAAPQISPDPAGRFGSAPPLTSTGAAPEGSIEAPAAVPPAKPAPPPPPSAANAPATTSPR